MFTLPQIITNYTNSLLTLFVPYIHIVIMHLGMLYYSPQIWCCTTDALTRMKIQYGTSLAYPTRCVGAHISTVPNHITGSTVCYA